MIIISSPSEFVVLPPLPFTKETWQTFLIGLGYMWRQPAINNLSILPTTEIHEGSYFIMFSVQDRFFIARLKEIRLWRDTYYRKEIRFRQADLQCVIPNNNEYESMRHKVMATCPLNSLYTNKIIEGFCYELWDFKAIIIKREREESIEDTKHIGIGMLTLLRKT
ncbi:hypothetical protein J7J18_04750 [bacterium]|nr:hypothetical protein [bacterium]